MILRMSGLLIRKADCFFPARRLFVCVPAALGFGWVFCVRGALSVCLRRWPFLDLILDY
jgi:hypothetical protein